MNTNDLIHKQSLVPYDGISKIYRSTIHYIVAEPITLGEYNELRGWTLPSDEDPSTEGYLVCLGPVTGSLRTKGSGATFMRSEDFHERYRRLDAYGQIADAQTVSDETVVVDTTQALEGNLTFGEALMLLHQGKAVTRSGWAKEGWGTKVPFVYKVEANSYVAQSGVAKAHFGEGALVPYNPYFALKNAHGTVSMWVPSMADCLASDWQTVDPTKR